MTDNTSQAHTVTILAATPDDWERTRALRLAALADTPDAFAATLADERDQPERFWRARLERPDVCTLLAVITDTRGTARDAGLAVVAPTSDDATAAGLYSVWVAPEARGRGVGDAVLRAAIAHARRAGRSRLVLEVGDHNAPAIALYQRAGFRPTGRTTTLPPPREHVTEHEMELLLTAR